MDNNWLDKTNYILNWIVRLAYINLLWILFTLLGGIVFGFIPSTVAVFSIMRKWLNNNDDFPVIHNFFYYYKQEFIKSNLLGFILLLVGIFLYIDSQLIMAVTGPMKVVLLGSFATVGVLYVLILLYIFPVFVQYKNGVFQYIKSALLIGISYPFRTLFMSISVVSILFICFVFPAISFLFLGSGLSFIIMFFSNHLFIRITAQQIITN